MSVYENVRHLLQEIPENVQVIAAAKTRSLDEVRQSIEAGIRHIGENYVQELELIGKNLEPAYRSQITLHMIGHLQSNKINKALQYCDAIQTIDSISTADKINQKVQNFRSSPLPVLIEINIANEEAKNGANPSIQEIVTIAEALSQMENLRLEGLMTLGPWDHTAEELRPYFKKMKSFFEQLKTLNLPNTKIQTLSMGMSDSYHVAIEEGASMVRLGTVLFGKRT
ncbi:MAG: YggS family pyridoxal phosphate-dependent enzyme [Candidatus Marinimicrobia bacterium]|nr:YggS family pyridoxal phosphate-dependent enzyme [Candidatus Neomarinimicrobiota bacterium]